MKRGRFPQRIKRGSCVVTIYRTRNKDYVSFTVAHYDANGRFCRRTFADYEQAHDAAEKTTEGFAGGSPEEHVLSGQELLIYRRATDALKDAGVPLDVAAIQFARSMADGIISITNGTAASSESATLPSVQAVSVAQVVDELLASKKAKGRSHLYLTDLRVRLTRFAKADNRPLSKITSDDIDKFLESLGISARSQNNFRATIGMLFRFGQAKGYVARNHPGVSHVDKASHTAQEVQVFTHDEIQALLRVAKDDLVPAIAIGAFAGVRSEELKRLAWEDIQLNEGHIEIKGAKSKTKVRRLIPIQKNLKSWLLPYVQKMGPVVHRTSPSVSYPFDSCLLRQSRPYLVETLEGIKPSFRFAVRRKSRHEFRNQADRSRLPLFGRICIDRQPSCLPVYVLPRNQRTFLRPDCYVGANEGERQFNRSSLRYQKLALLTIIHFDPLAGNPHPAPGSRDSRMISRHVVVVLGPVHKSAYCFSMITPVAQTADCGCYILPILIRCDVPEGAGKHTREPMEATAQRGDVLSGIAHQLAISQERFDHLRGGSGIL